MGYYYTLLFAYQLFQGKKMTQKKCSICGEDAIGAQVYGCCGSYVCLEHADSNLRKLAPGEKLELGACYYLRFSE
ncbi:MAG: hypothetical protein D5R99_08405 [Methanocalculus sp. MSAO_Arc1]|nr:MAG: hypothetical protein D5R99_08405 [Methanocalculus sp. MSAO_Arc1]